MESASVSAPPGSPRLREQGFRMIFTEPGPRLGRERLRNGGNRWEPVGTGEWRELVCRMDFSRVLETVKTRVDDYGSGGWGFEFLRACW